MTSLILQTFAVIRMNIQSLPRRLWMSFAMVFASAVVVAILLAFLSMANGFEATLKNAGSPQTALFLRAGSASEINSSVTREQLNVLETLKGIEKVDGKATISGELYVIVDGIKKSTQTEANIPLRGLNASSFNLRQGFELVQGREFTPGTNEIMVGKSILEQFEGFELNSEMRLGKNIWRIVGVFSTGGNVFESELWTDIKVLQSVYQRGSGVQSVRAKLESAQEAEALIDSLKKIIEEDPRLNLDVLSEAEYFSEQGKALDYMAVFGTTISMVMALGAIAGALNTMYSSVADRAKEIATLRTIGFSNTSAFFGTLVESLFLSALGGAIGAFFAYLIFDGLSTSTLGGSFTQVVFSFSFSRELIQEGIVLSLTIGLISGFFPAWRAAKMPILLAFRSRP